MDRNLNPEQLIRQVFDLVKDAIPPGLEGVGQEFKQNLRATVTESLAKFFVTSFSLNMPRIHSTLVL